MPDTIASLTKQLDEALASGAISKARDIGRKISALEAKSEKASASNTAPAKLTYTPTEALEAIIRQLVSRAGNPDALRELLAQAYPAPTAQSAAAKAE